MKDSKRNDFLSGRSTGPHRAAAALQDNATAFFASFQGRHAAMMACRRGCSACCHVSLSIFTVEASLILAWARGLAPADAHKLAIALAQRETSDRAGKTPPGPTPDGELAQPCPFLVNCACSIYPARPTLCRTQGLPLVWQDEDLGTGGPAVRNPQARLNVCPLHPGYGQEGWPPVAESLDVDRLNTLLSLAQNSYEAEGNTTGEKDQTSTSPAASPGDARIPLSTLRTLVIGVCKETAAGLVES